MVEALARPLDLLRAKILRHSVKIEALRHIFVERSLRNNVTVAFSLILNALLMIFCPLWMLMIAPSLLGMLHLIESLHAFHDVAAPHEFKSDAARKKNINRGLLIFCVGFFLLRITLEFSRAMMYGDIAVLLVKNLRLFDCLIVAMAFFYCSFIYRLKIHKFFIGLSILSSALYFLLAGPSLVWSFFIFSHNFMAFVFWYFYAPSRKEKNSAIIALGVFGLLHVAVLSKFGDNFFLHAINQRATGAFGYDFATISIKLFPDNYDLLFARKIVSLLCFGQGVHYLLWIRVIPDCRFEKKATMPFRTKFKKLRTDFGTLLSSALVIVVAIFLLAPLFLRFNVINDLFFALAFFHIYAEFLAFLFAGLHKNNMALSA